MADTIDGGVDASDEVKKNALIGCDTGGGMLGVKSIATNPAYNTAEYLATKSKPEGIILKVVKAPVSCVSAVGVERWVLCCGAPTQSRHGLAAAPQDHSRPRG